MYTGIHNRSTNSKSNETDMQLVQMHIKLHILTKHTAFQKSTEV